MFKTAIKDSDNSDVIIKASLLSTPPRSKLSLLDFRPNTQIKNNLSAVPSRPKSTMLGKRNNHSTLNSPMQSNIIKASSLKKVQDQLEGRFKSDLSTYLRSKLRQLISRTQEKKRVNQYLSSTIDEETENVYKLPLRTPKLWFGQQQKRGEDKIDNPYLIDAKQRIIRLIDLKKEREANYSQMSNKIRERCLSNEKQRIRSLNTISQEHTIDNEEWNQDWCKEQKLQAKRYRNRLLLKFKKQSSKQIKIQ